MKTRSLTYGLLAALLAAGCGGGGGSGDELQADLAAPLFQDQEVHDVHLTIDPDDWQSIIDDTRGDEYRRATFRWKDEIADDVGVRPVGEFSRFPGNPKQSVRIKFDEYREQVFLGLKNLKLDGLSTDPSMMRDRLSYGIFRTQIVAPRTSHARLFVNGAYHGLYMLEERVDATMMKTRFSGETGYLYRLQSWEFDPYAYTGPEGWRYVPFPWNPVNKETNEDHTHVLRYVEHLDWMPEELSSIANLDTLLSYLAVEAVITQTDGVTSAFGPSNHYQYFRPDTGTFEIIPWDCDSTWNDFPTRDIFTNFDRTRLTQVVSGLEGLRAEYQRRIHSIVAGQLPVETVLAEIDRIYAQIADAAHADPNKPFDNWTFDDNKEFLKRYAVDRWASLASQTEGSLE